MKLNFFVDEELYVGLNRLTKVLGYEIGGGTAVYAQKGESIGASYKNGKATVYYKEKHHFWRELSVLIENLKKGADFEIFEDTHFDTLGLMVCVSRGMVPTNKTLEKYIDYLAVMGYNLIMLQTDDLFEVDGRPYFGYMRGRYTKDELRAFDDYAYEYGIEAIPCIECYSHLKTYLLWPEAAEIKDTADVLMAREEKTFEFVEAMISNISPCFRSRRIHIGMDEAWDMGRGNFLIKHGKVPLLQIFNEYMERLIAITNKYGLKPMMWSDMYFRASRTDNIYYHPDTVIPEETKKAIPKEVELIFWNYGEEPKCDYFMLKQHKELNRPIISCGGLWEWTGHFPNNDYSLEVTDFSVNACRDEGITKFMTTAWFINSECDMFATLLGLSNTASLVYNTAPTEEYRSSRFETETSADFDAFNIMTRYHNKCDGRKYYGSDARFLGKHFFWQDIMSGLYDYFLFKESMSEHYKESLEMIKKHRYSGEWDYLYEYCEAVFDYLYIKCYIAERLYPAYHAGDRECLKKIASELLPDLRKKTERVHAIHRSIWFKYNKDQGFLNNDIHYGGMIARIDYAIIKLNAYLNGECDKLGELEEARLEKSLWAFSPYSMIATPLPYV